MSISTVWDTCSREVVILMRFFYPPYIQWNQKTFSLLSFLHICYIWNGPSCLVLYYLSKAPPYSNPPLPPGKHVWKINDKIYPIDYGHILGKLRVQSKKLRHIKHAQVIWSPYISFKNIINLSTVDTFQIKIPIRSGSPYLFLLLTRKFSTWSYIKLYPLSTVKPPPKTTVSPNQPSPHLMSDYHTMEKWLHFHVN